MRWSIHTPVLLRRYATAGVAEVHARPPVVLRPYQEQALQACTDALAEGASRIGVSLPTGSGKTTVFLSLLDRIPSPKSNPKATRALVIVNAIELARQAAAQAKHLFPDWTVEIDQGQKYKASGLADV
jgi:ATP-dependent helicase IRC3